MQYLYILVEDAEITQTEREPTTGDFASIEDGLLRVVRFNKETNVFEDLQANGSWQEFA